jgi:hypothetical protein
MNKSEHKKEKDLNIKANKTQKEISSFNHKSYNFVSIWINQNLILLNLIFHL